MQESIERQIKIFVQSEIGDSVQALEAVRTKVEELLKTNSKIGQDSKLLGQEVKKIINQYRESNKAMLDFSTSAEKNISKQTGLVNNLNKSLFGTQSVLYNLLAPVKTIAYAVGGGSAFGILEATKSVITFNNQLAINSISLRKYGINVNDTVGFVKRLSNETGLAQEEISNFTKSFEKGFNYVSLSGAESTLKNIQKVVGSDTDAIRQMTSELSAFSQQFPDLEQSIQRMTDLDKVRLEGTSRLLVMTGKLSMSQYKGIQDYIKGQTIASKQEQQRIKDLQASEKAVQEMRTAFTNIALDIGKTFLPVLKSISSIITSYPGLIKTATLSLSALLALKMGKGLITSTVPAANNMLFGIPGKLLGMGMGRSNQANMGMTGMTSAVAMAKNSSVVEKAASVGANKAINALDKWQPKGKIGAIVKMLGINAANNAKSISSSDIRMDTSVQKVFVVGGRLDRVENNTGESTDLMDFANQLFNKTKKVSKVEPPPLPVKNITVAKGATTSNVFKSAISESSDIIKPGIIKSTSATRNAILGLGRETSQATAYAEDLIKSRNLFFKNSEEAVSKLRMPAKVAGSFNLLGKGVAVAGAGYAGYQAYQDFKGGNNAAGVANIASGGLGLGSMASGAGALAIPAIAAGVWAEILKNKNSKEILDIGKQTGSSTSEYSRTALSADQFWGMFGAANPAKLVGEGIPYLKDIPLVGKAFSGVNGAIDSFSDGLKSVGLEDFARKLKGIGYTSTADIQAELERGRNFDLEREQIVKTAKSKNVQESEESKIDMQTASGSVSNLLTLRKKYEDQIKNLKKESKIEIKQQKFENLQKNFQVEKDEKGNITGGKFTDGRKASDKDVADRISLLKDLSSEINEIGEKEQKLISLRDKADMGAIANQQLLARNIQVTTEYYQAQSSLLQSISNQIGAIGSASEAQRSQMNQGLNEALSIMLKTSAARKEFLNASLQVDQDEQNKQQQSIVNAQNEIKKIQDDAKNRGGGLTDQDNTNIRNQQSAIMQAQKQISASRLESLSKIKQMQADENILAKTYADQVASLAQLNRAERERIQVRQQYYASLGSVQGASGNIRQALGSNLDLITKESISNITRLREDINGMSKSATYWQSRMAELSKISNDSMIEMFDETGKSLGKVTGARAKEVAQATFNAISTEGYKAAKEYADLQMAYAENIIQSINQAAKVPGETIASQRELTRIQRSLAAGAGSVGQSNSLAQKEYELVFKNVELQKGKLSSLESQIEKAKKMGASTAMINDLENKRRDLVTEINKQLSEQKNFIDATLDSYAKVGAYQDSIVAKMEAQLELVNSVGLGLSASAEQRMAVFDQIGEKVKIEQDAYREVQNNLVILQSTLKKQLMSNASQDEINSTNEAILHAKTLIEQKDAAILQLQQKQLNITKSIRDGYVSAITAMTAGSGMITKIVVDQNRNMGVAIRNLGMLQSMSTGGLGGNIRNSGKFNMLGGITEDKNRTENMYKTYNDAGSLEANIKNAQNMVKNALKNTKGTAAQFGISPVAAGAAIANANIQNGASILGTDQNKKIEQLKSQLTDLENTLKNQINTKASAEKINSTKSIILNVKNMLDKEQKINIIQEKTKQSTEPKTNNQSNYVMQNVKLDTLQIENKLDYISKGVYFIANKNFSPIVQVQPSVVNQNPSKEINVSTPAVNVNTSPQINITVPKDEIVIPKGEVSNNTINDTKIINNKNEKTFNNTVNNSTLSKIELAAPVVNVAAPVVNLPEIKNINIIKNEVKIDKENTNNKSNREMPEIKVTPVFNIPQLPKVDKSQFNFEFTTSDVKNIMMNQYNTQKEMLAALLSIRSVISNMKSGGGNDSKNILFTNSGNGLQTSRGYP